MSRRPSSAARPHRTPPAANSPRTPHSHHRDEAVLRAARLGVSATGIQRLDDEYTPGTPSVYIRCMAKVRTNIEIEDIYLEAIMDRYGLRTKTEAVDLALRHLAGQPMTREEALGMRGARAIGKPPADSKPPGS